MGQTDTRTTGTVNIGANLMAQQYRCTSCGYKWQTKGRTARRCALCGVRFVNRDGQTGSWVKLGLLALGIVLIGTGITIWRLTAK